MWAWRPKGEPRLHVSHPAGAADAPRHGTGPAPLSAVGCRLPYLFAPGGESGPRCGLLDCRAQRRRVSIGAPLLASAPAHRVLRGLRLPPPLAGHVPHALPACDATAVNLYCSCLDVQVVPVMC